MDVDLFEVSVGATLPPFPLPHHQHVEDTAAQRMARRVMEQSPLQLRLFFLSAKWRSQIGLQN